MFGGDGANLDTYVKPYTTSSGVLLLDISTVPFGPSEAPSSYPSSSPPRYATVISSASSPSNWCLVSESSIYLRSDPSFTIAKVLTSKHPVLAADTQSH